MKEKKRLKKMAARSVKLVFHKRKINEVTAEEVIAILKTLPRSQAIYAISKFLKGLRRRGGETTAVVESAIPLSKKQFSEVIKRLSRDFVVTDAKNVVNPDILGGVRIRIGDTLLDDSVVGRISQVGKAMQSI